MFYWGGFLYYFECCISMHILCGILCYIERIVKMARNSSLFSLCVELRFLRNKVRFHIASEIHNFVWRIVSNAEFLSDILNCMQYELHWILLTVYVGRFVFVIICNMKQSSLVFNIDESNFSQTFIIYLCS